MPTPKPLWNVRFLMLEDKNSEPLWTSYIPVEARCYDVALNLASERLTLDDSKVIKAEVERAAP
jgi:hypothetical protein